MALVLLVVLSPEAIAGTESISLSNYQQESTPEYRINYRVEGTSLLKAKNDYISLFFYSQAVLPSNISPENILVNSLQAVKVRSFKDQKRIDVLVPADIEANQMASILIKPEAGIKNPGNPGTHKLGISSSKVSSVSYIEYDIIPETISTPVVEVNPKATGVAAEYSISFKVGAIGGLIGGTDTISITFPKEITVPSVISMNTIAVNGKTLDSGELTIKGNTITFTVPSNVSIDNEGQVNVIITPDADIKTPGNSGEYKLQASTSKDTTDILSEAYTLSDAAVTELMVDVDPLLVSAVTSYNISFKTSPYGSLQGGKDRITITFPGGMSQLTNIPRNSIEVQGKSIDTGKIDVDDRSISFTLPSNVSVGSESLVKIKIWPSAGMLNHSKPGASNIKLSTSRDIITATSNSYTINTGKTITLTIDSVTGYIDGKEVLLDAPAKIINNRAMVPVRLVSESIGARVDWDYDNREVTINSGGKYIKLYIDSKIASAGNKEITLDAAPTILNGRTMVPIRFIAEYFGSQVTWDDRTRSVVIKQ
jgi:hypothetical protein